MGMYPSLEVSCIASEVCGASFVHDHRCGSHRYAHISIYALRNIIFTFLLPLNSNQQMCKFYWRDESSENYFLLPLQENLSEDMKKNAVYSMPSFLEVSVL